MRNSKIHNTETNLKQMFLSPSQTVISWLTQNLPPPDSNPPQQPAEVLTARTVKLLDAPATEL